MGKAPKSRSLPRLLARGAIRAYQLSLSSLLGRQCRYLPTCSEYADEAIARHGAWAGGWMGLARLCRCHPWGSSGFDPVPPTLPERAHWLAPWRYGIWRGRFECAAIPPQDSSSPAAQKLRNEPSIPQ